MSANENCARGSASVGTLFVGTSRSSIVGTPSSAYKESLESQVHSSWTLWTCRRRFSQGGAHTLRETCATLRTPANEHRQGVSLGRGGGGGGGGGARRTMMNHAARTMVWWPAAVVTLILAAFARGVVAGTYTFASGSTL